MINEEVLSEKLKYLIQMNAKANQFNIEKIVIEFEYIDQLHTKLDNYDVDIKFDYEGSIEFDLYSFIQDIKVVVHFIGFLWMLVTFGVLFIFFQ